MAKIRKCNVIYTSYRYKGSRKIRYMGRCALKNVARKFLKLKNCPCYIIAAKEK